MLLIDKAYFTLEELAERWRLPLRDLVYLAENGLLRLSVRLFGVGWNSGDMRRMRTTSGLGRAGPSAVHRVPGPAGTRRVPAVPAGAGRREVSFTRPEHEYCRLIEPTESVSDFPRRVLVRREERDRVEAQHDLVRKGPPRRRLCVSRMITAKCAPPGFSFNLGPVQARVVKRLHEAATSSNPWCEGKLILGEAGSSSTRMADVFKSQSHWRRLIDSDGRGRYRLRVSQR